MQRNWLSKQTGWRMLVWFCENIKADWEERANTICCPQKKVLDRIKDIWRFKCQFELLEFGGVPTLTTFISAGGDDDDDTDDCGGKAWRLITCSKQWRLMSNWRCTKDYALHFVQSLILITALKKRSKSAAKYWNMCKCWHCIERSVRWDFYLSAF